MSRIQKSAGQRLPFPITLSLGGGRITRQDHQLIRVGLSRSSCSTGTGRPGKARNSQRSLRGSARPLTGALAVRCVPGSWQGRHWRLWGWLLAGAVPAPLPAPLLAAMAPAAGRGGTRALARALAGGKGCARALAANMAAGRGCTSALASALAGASCWQRRCPHQRAPAPVPDRTHRAAGP